MKHIDYIFDSLGFPSTMDFIKSTFGFILNKYILLAVLPIGGILDFLSSYIGIKQEAYIGFVLLFLIEFVSGVYVALKIRKEKFSSYKSMRVFIKIVVYTLVLGSLFSISKNYGQVSLFGFDFNIINWIYYVFFVGMVTQLFISILENLQAAGWKEVSWILVLTKKKQKAIEKQIENSSNDDIVDEDINI